MIHGRNNTFYSSDTHEENNVCCCSSSRGPRYKTDPTMWTSALKSRNTSFICLHRNIFYILHFSWQFHIDLVYISGKLLFYWLVVTFVIIALQTSYLAGFALNILFCDSWESSWHCCLHIPAPALHRDYSEVHRTGREEPFQTCAALCCDAPAGVSVAVTLVSDECTNLSDIC